MIKKNDTVPKQGQKPHRQLSHSRCRCTAERLYLQTDMNFDNDAKNLPSMMSKKLMNMTNNNRQSYLC